DRQVPRIPLYVPQARLAGEPVALLEGQIGAAEDRPEHVAPGELCDLGLALEGGDLVAAVEAGEVAAEHQVGQEHRLRPGDGELAGVQVARIRAAGRQAGDPRVEQPVERVAPFAATQRRVQRQVVEVDAS